MSQSEFEKLIVVPFLCIIIKKKIMTKVRRKAVSTAKSSKEKGMKTNSCVSENTLIVADIIGIDEVCKITGLSRSTIYKKTSNHEIPFYKSTLSKRSFLRFRRSEIVNWMLRHRIGTIDEFLESQDCVYNK
mgnify:CR=1 FL=1